MLNFTSIENRFVHSIVKECPHCDRGIKAIVLKMHDEEFDGTIYVHLICECPSCHQTFFAEYSFEQILDVFGFPRFLPEPTYYPFKKKCISIEKEIKELSPNFEKAFEEASTIENLNFLDLAGLGYRRAFEFLIKDYVIYLTPDKKQDIIDDSSVSNIINNRIPSSLEFHKLKEISKRAWWLGSDYAHYKKHYQDKDISDLKECIDLARFQITLDIKYNYQISTIQKKENKTKQSR